MLHAGAMRRFLHLDCGAPSEDLGHQAAMPGIEVLHHQDRHWEIPG
jgi:hypothetical protein